MPSVSSFGPSSGCWNMRLRWVGDDHQIARRPACLEPAGRVRDEHALDAEPRHRSHAVHDLPERMALVVVHAALHADDRHVADVSKAEVAVVSDHLRGGEVRQLLVGHLHEIGQRVGKGTEPAAEDDADARRERDLGADGAHGFVEAFGDARLLVAHGGRHVIMRTSMTARRVDFDHTDPGLRAVHRGRSEDRPRYLRAGALRGAIGPRAGPCRRRHRDPPTPRPGHASSATQVPTTRRLLPVCQSGCSYCCKAAVFASAPESPAHRGLPEGDALPGAARDPAGARRGDGTPRRRPRHRRPPPRPASRAPCSTTRPGAAASYEVRPVACRAYHSGSVEACKKAFDTGGREPGPACR